MLSLTLTMDRDQEAPARARTMIRGLRPLLGEERTEDATLLDWGVVHASMHVWFELDY